MISSNKIADQDFENVALDFSELPDFKSVKTQGLHRRYLTVLRCRLLFFFILYLTGAGLVFFFLGLPIQKFLLIFSGPLLVFLILFVEFEIGFHKRQIGVRSHDLYYTRGFFYHKETLVPFKHIQHVEVSQNVILKWFGLYEVIFYTAGASAGDLNIRGLDESTSRKLKSIVMQKNESDESNEQL
ncbi:MAG: PH domain-containing protein [Psychroflexus sp.]|nr:PH domain-containing protein [Psychroflexus sp.]MDN6310304.1 PH domain-containing protein [Psychroflexus sp.]